MKNNNVMVYGAYGHIGQMIVNALIKQGCKPILAGRNKDKLQTLTDQTGLACRCFSLDKAKTALADIELVINAAGPFSYTAEQLATSALHQDCHYLDVGNEPVGLQAVYSLNPQAIACGRIALPGAGFGTTASNCLLHQLLPLVQQPVAATILLAPQIDERGSATRQTLLQGVRQGCSEVHDGRLVGQSGWQAANSRQLPFGKLTLVNVPLGDATAAFHSTGIPRIAACIGMPFPPFIAGTALELGRKALTINFIYRYLTRKQPNNVGSEVSNKVTMKSHVWASVQDASGKEYEVWMETGEANAFTAESAARAAMRLMGGTIKMSGALTPAMMFGGEWLREIPGTAVYRTPRSPEDNITT